jgi:hypothetical protein
MSEGTAIVVSPLIALMKNQVDAIRSFSSEEGVAHFLNSSLTRNEAIRVKKDIRDGRTKLLYVAPESLTKKENVEFLSDIPISFFAIDEAHCISEWGHDFRPEYRRLRTIFDEIQRVPMIALTATATEKVQEDILKNLDIPDANVFKAVNAIQPSGRGELEITDAIQWLVTAGYSVFPYIHKGWWVDTGKPIDMLLKDAKVWGPRAVPVKKALQRLSTAALEAALQHAGQIDRLAKGIGQGNIWEEFLRLGLRLSAKK